MKLFLIRHPKPEVTKGLCYGQLDVPLMTDWQQSAEPLKQQLIQYISSSTKTSQARCAYYHSPLSRAALLAEYLSDGRSHSVDALKELDFGKWEGRCWEDIPKTEIDLWMQDIVLTAPYEGESLQDLAERLWQWWSQLAHDELDACVLVAHAGVIKVLVSLLCQWPLAQCHRIDVGFCSVTELQIMGDFIQLKRLGAGDWVL